MQLITIIREGLDDGVSATQPEKLPTYEKCSHPISSIINLRDGPTRDIAPLPERA